MSAPVVYLLEPVQYLRVLTSGLTGLLDSLDAGAERESLRDNVDALLLLACQGQDVATEEMPAAKSGKKEAPKEQGPLFAVATDLEEAAALLRGVLDGLENAIDVYPEPRHGHMRILLDRFAVELARVETQMDAVYALSAATNKTEPAR